MIKVVIKFTRTPRLIDDEVQMYFDDYSEMNHFIGRLNKISTQPFTYQWTDKWKGKRL